MNVIHIQQQSLIILHAVLKYLAHKINIYKDYLDSLIWAGKLTYTSFCFIDKVAILPYAIFFNAFKSHIQQDICIKHCICTIYDGFGFVF